jgi:hypothetical protein
MAVMSCRGQPRVSGGRSIKGDEEVKGFTSPRKTGTISLAFPFFFLFIVNNGQERGLDLNWFSDFLKTDFYYLWGWSMPHCLQDTQRQNLFSSRDGILGRHCDKRLKPFSLCYSQSLLLADFTENTYFILVLKIHINFSRNKKTPSLFTNNIFFFLSFLLFLSY